MMALMDPLNAFKQASDLFLRLVGQVKSDQWVASTPDTEWDVKALVQHVVEGLAWVPDMVAGKTIAEVGDKYAGDLLGQDPTAATKLIIQAALKALAEPGVMERTTHLSYGDFPAQVYIGHMAIDSLIHAWDLRTAIGSNESIPDELAQAIYDLFVPQAEEWRSAGIMAPAVAVAEEADALTKLIALSGRDPESMSS